jgi:hypothetical protein
VFIGHWEGQDIYWCPQSGIPTIVARWGDDGPQYQSGTVQVGDGEKAITLTTRRI